jgi:hypothetical protein
MTLSTPGVRFPGFETTLRTAQNLAGKERTSVRWRKVTFPQRFSRTASAIRTCSRLTRGKILRQSMAFQSSRQDGSAPASGFAIASLCPLPFRDVSACSLAEKDPSDVGSLSCRVTLKPVSTSLQGGLRFFRHPKPAPPSARLAACVPLRERYGVSTFRF